jgi:23S rRNA (guanosine2251-2'-O)-methyltransferase
VVIARIFYIMEIQLKKQLMKSETKNYIIYGKHAVEAAILNEKRKISEILCTEQNFDYLKKISNGRKINLVKPEQIKSLFPEHTPTQNIAAKVSPIVIHHIPKEILDKPNCKLVILDKITDPQNLGSILRSSAAFGIDAVIYPKDGGATENGAVAKAASGALDIVPLIEVVNINNVMLDIKKHGFWVLGLDGTAKENIKGNKVLDGKVAVVMGSEGTGLRPLVAKNCDVLVKISISAKMESLNVSNAAAIVFYEIGTLTK